jgi:3-oxoacyl-[acyl-carrier protein] reductase
MKRFEGKVVIITGAGRGIGKAVAQKLAKEGAIVIVVDIDEENAQTVSKSINSDGNFSMAIRCDVASFKETENMVERVIERFGRIDILVNNAGITRDAMINKMSPEQWQAVIDVNLTGMFNVTRNVVPYMRDRLYGRIVNVSSMGAYGSIGQANYAAAKMGVVGLTYTLAKELGRKNITVNAVLPEVTDTEMIKTIPEEVLRSIIESIPLQRLATPEEQANAICFLASDEASFISGAVLKVSGGT